MAYSKNPSEETKIRVDFIKSHPEISTSQLAEIFNMTETTAKILIYSHMPTGAHIPWTKEQDAFLQRHKNKSRTWLVENMPGTKHSKNSVQHRRQVLGMTEKPTPWTKKQTKFLIEHADKSDTWISENMPEPKRKRSSINHTRKILGIAPDKKSEHWTTEQDDFLKEHQNKSIQWLMGNMPEPERTYKSISARRIHLGLTEKPVPWTDEQITFVKTHADKNGTWISRNMPEPRKSEQMVNYMRRKLSISPNGKERWTKEQTDFLINHAGKDDEWISKNMPEPRKSKQSVESKRIRENLAAKSQDVI